MGRRELFIAIGFLVAGTVAYWLTAPRSAKRALPNSLPAMVDEWREGAARSAARETVQTTGSHALDAPTSEVRLTGFTRVVVVGEDRRDLNWTLAVEASGPTPDAARAAARAIEIGEDNLGDALALTPKSSSDDRPSTTLTVHLPNTMAVRLEGSRRVEADGTGRIRLEAIVGDVTLRSIAGAVTGSHRNGAIDITGAAAVNLNLNGSRANISNVRGEVTLTARNGECRLVDVSGPVVVDTNDVKFTAVEPGAAVRVNATSGAIAITNPHDAVHVDARRSEVNLSLERAIAATLVGTETRITLTLADELPVELDASITNGAIEATSVGLTPEKQGDVSRLRHTFGSTARTTIRGTRGSIVIARRK